MIYKLLHTLLARFISLFVFWIPEVVERKKFELKNKKDVGAQSFKQQGIRADFCFEFSSEGEFAQINSLVEDALALGKKIELVMFSPSVEKQVLALYEKHPEQIRYLRYPLLTYSCFSQALCFTNWVTSKTLYLVRYDFFPEFLFWSRRPGHFLKLLWLSFKKTRLQNKKLSKLKIKFLQASSLNVFATQEDLDFVKPLGFSGIIYDFRMEQIHRRKLNRQTKFSQHFANHSQLLNHLRQSPQQLIFGNAWLSDLHLLEKLPDACSVLIVPHQLDQKNLTSFQVELEKLGLDSQLVDQNTTHFQAPVLILNMKGVLCELYADFTHAYVGGGFGASIHSVLEPLITGSAHISCGPVNNRSTEFDIAKSHHRLSEVLSPSEFNTWLKRFDSQALVFDSSQYLFYRKEVIGC